MSGFEGKKILVTGGAGFLGGPLIRNLVERGARPDYVSVPEYPRFDLRRPADCADVVAGKDIVIHLAANAGGIAWNQAHPGALFYDNAAMGIHLMEESRKAGVKKFVQIGTVCAYPFQPPRIPFREDDLWAGYPEPTNAPYGIAKKAMMVMGQAYREEYGFNVIYLLPVNLYGPRDHFFEPEKSHVIPALIQKFVDARESGAPEVVVWGSGVYQGTPVSREFLYVDDAAEGDRARGRAVRRAGTREHRGRAGGPHQRPDRDDPRHDRVSGENRPRPFAAQTASRAGASTPPGRGRSSASSPARRSRKGCAGRSRGTRRRDGNGDSPTGTSPPTERMIIR